MKTYALLVMIGGIFFMSGCASTVKHASPDEFKALYNRAPSITTMNSLVYIGHAEGKAYIEEDRTRLIGKGSKCVIYYIYLHELDPAFRDKLSKTKPEAEMPPPRIYKFDTGSLQSGTLHLAH